MSPPLRLFLGPRCKHVSLGGAYVPPATLRFVQRALPKASVHDNYGITEVPGIAQDGVVSSSVQLKLVPLPRGSNSEQPTPRQAESSCGGTPVPPAAPEAKEGEIWVKPRLRSPGYLNDPVATAASYTTDGWFKTGDLGQRIAQV